MAEPLYCTQCGAEDWACTCEDDGKGEYCDVCGAHDDDREAGCRYCRGPSENW